MGLSFREIGVATKKNTGKTHDINQEGLHSFIFYKNIIFFLKPLKAIEIATSKITTMFLIFELFQGLMFL